MRKTITLSMLLILLLSSCKQTKEIKKEVKETKTIEKKQTKEIKNRTYVSQRMLKYYTNRKYDVYYRRYFHQYFSEFESFYTFNIIKAQSIQESLLKKNAVSYVGARGLMQFMPGTEKQVKRELKILMKNPSLNPEMAIWMGCYYDRKLFNQWKTKRKLKDRYSLTFASYNAGLGNLLKSQKECKRRTGGKCISYEDIEKHLKYVTGKYSKETRTYVMKIWKYYIEMEMMK